MKAIFDERQRLHDPQHFMANGKTYPSPEAPERITRLTAGVPAAGCSLTLPLPRGTDDAGYLAARDTALARIAAAISGLGLPLLLMQEDGYVSDVLADNLSAFLGGVA